MRQILDFNENWWFIHADVDVSEARPGEGELVSLPHTWNALDGQKGDGTYDRGSYWYVKTLDSGSRLRSILVYFWKYRRRGSRQKCL